MGGQLARGLAAVIVIADSPPHFADDSDPLLSYIPLLRKAVVTMPEDDPQEHEDEHVKEVKKKTGAQ
jgi:hypothetical protein